MNTMAIANHVGSVVQRVNSISANNKNDDDNNEVFNLMPDFQLYVHKSPEKFISIQREFRYFDSTCLCFLLLALIQFYTCQNRFRNLTARITQI
jgi:hypothetical protein